MDFKRCSRCKETKAVVTENWRPDRKGTFGVYAYCRPCAQQKQRELRKAKKEEYNKAARQSWRKQDWAKRLLGNGGKKGMNRRQLSVEFLHQLLERQQGRCYFTNVPLNTDAPGGDELWKYRVDAVSLDRLDPTKEYTPDNVVLVCLMVNIGRRTASVEETRDFIQAILIHSAETV